MPWLSLRLAVDGDRAEALSDALMAAGALSVAIEDRDAGTAAEEAQFGEPGLADPKSWKRNWLVALLDEDADVAALLSGLGLPADSEYEVETVAEQDWVRLTQSQFDPIPISGRLWIVPSWHQAPDPQAITIVLDPGLAFGTGSHPTTRLCLQWLEANLRGGETVLDYGCGSGILAIAAARLGAARVVGVDIDPLAVQAARDNASSNGVACEFMLPGELADGLYDVVVANILTNPLKALMPLLAAHVRSGGTIVLSGILEAQAGEVMAIYADTFAMRHDATEEGWARLSGIRK
ncbi:MAG: 50S ribosomal protein L11 methyltransferase [Gallionellaceae bacterium]|nr:50S ribosomal protein L11 methyltransferase [Gallionellaceae bacterium]